MKLLILIICLVAQRFYSNSVLSNHVPVFQRYTEALSHHVQRLATWNCWCALIAFVLPAIILIAGIQWLLNGWHILFGLWPFLFSIVVLLFCLRTQPKDEQLQSCHAALDAEDLPQAANAAETVFERSFVATTPTSFITLLSQALLNDALCYLFSIIFWYILLGPAAAVSIRLLDSLQRHLAKQETVPANFLASACHSLLYYLHWPVVRLMALSFALIGNFSVAFACWLKHAASLQSHQNFLGDNAIAALAIDPVQHQPSTQDHRLIIEMLNHSLVVWLIAMVLVQMGEWLL
jgi:AmpE protein